MKRSRLLAIACTCLFSFGAHTTLPAATLLNTGTLNSADDLTTIQTGGGDILEWLDLSVTDAMSVAGALSIYQDDGFRWATGNEVAELFDAFGITYGFTSGSQYNLGVDSATAQNFVDYLGATGGATGAAALGWIDDLTDDSYYTWACIGPDCKYNGFVGNAATSIWPSHFNLGVYLVRDEINPVPLPATVWLFGSGLLGLIGIARRKKTV